MITIAEMIDDLRKCYKCSRRESCFGCPYNGSKLDIIEFLKRIENNKMNGNVDENQQQQIEIVREAFKNLAGLMCDLCNDNNSFRFDNGYARLQEAKFWFIEAICKD